MVLWVAAPPCQDVSRVRETRPGHDGTRGSLFLDTVALMHEVFAYTGRRRTGFIYENVVMAKADAAAITHELGNPPVLACAGDFGWITRPRLWWLSIDVAATVDQTTDKRPTTVRLQDGWRRLRLDQERPAAESIDTAGWQFDEAVKSGRLRLPCSTTPAADENGRPAPKGARGKMSSDVRARWLADRRQFAPWHYRREAMLTDEHGKLRIPTPEIKEQLHNIPKAYTAVDGLDDRTRHRLLGNGWHWGVARRLLTLLVVGTFNQPTTASTVHRTPAQTTIQWVIDQLPPAGLTMAPRPAKNHQPLVSYDLDERQHWETALALPHPATKPPELEQGWEELILVVRRWRHDLPRIRTQVIQEIQGLIDEGEEDLQLWLQQRPEQVKATFTTPDKPKPTQCLVLLKLLRAVKYPDVDGLR